MFAETTKSGAVGRGAPGRERVPRAERERQMLAAATKTFARRGYHATSMDEIADAVGVTKPMLYTYFGSKEGLFAACTRDAAAGLREELREVVKAERPPDQLFYAGILAVFEFVERNRSSWLVLYAEGGVAAGEAARARDDMAVQLEELFREVAARSGVDEGALEHTRTMALAMTVATIAVATEWAREAREPKELAALRLMNFAWMGFGDLLEGKLWLPSDPP